MAITASMLDALFSVRKIFIAEATSLPVELYEEQLSLFEL